MIYETSITNPKKQLEFYKGLSEQLQQENKELKQQLEKKYEKLGTLTAEILYEENTRLVNEITVLKTENQKLKEMQCTFLGTGCQNKMKKYKEVIDKVNKLIAENSEKYWIDDEGEPKYLFNEIRDILSKWKCEICGVEFENFHAQGFDNKIYCPLCYFKRENQELKKQLEEINNFINKANFANIEQLMLDYCAKTEEQKEFIQYLENWINKTDYEVNVLGNYKYLAWSNAYKNALTKYKEIIGDKE